MSRAYPRGYRCRAGSYKWKLQIIHSKELYKYKDATIQIRECEWKGRLVPDMWNPQKLYGKNAEVGVWWSVVTPLSFPVTPQPAGNTWVSEADEDLWRMLLTSWCIWKNIRRPEVQAATRSLQHHREVTSNIRIIRSSSWWRRWPEWKQVGSRLPWWGREFLRWVAAGMFRCGVEKWPGFLSQDCNVKNHHPRAEGFCKK